MNIFDNAKETKKGKTKVEKTEVVVNDKDLHSQLHRLARIEKLKSALEAEEKLIGAQLKSTTISKFCELYDSTGIYPGSFNVVLTGESSIPNVGYMAVPMDKYLSIDEDQYDFLLEKYGKDVVEKNTTYIMDTALVEKYGSVISSLILKCKDIPEEDKLKLISKTVNYTVSKGIITKLKVGFKQKVKEIVEDISPIFSKKNLRIIK